MHMDISEGQQVIPCAVKGQILEGFKLARMNFEEPCLKGQSPLVCDRLAAGGIGTVQGAALHFMGAALGDESSFG